MDREYCEKFTKIQENGKKWSQDGSKMDRGYCEKFTKTQENEEKWGQDGEYRALRRGFVMIL